MCLANRHWKLGHSTQSNLTHSGSDTEEPSAATTVHHFSPETTDPSLPDLLSSSSSPKQTRFDKQRPRSCVDPGVLSKPSFKLGEDVNSIANKRWSGISLSSKLFQAYNRLQQETSEEEYTDSLEAGSHAKSKTALEARKEERAKEEGGKETGDCEAGGREIGNREVAAKALGLKLAGLRDEPSSNEDTVYDGPESLDSNFSDDKPLNGRRFKKLQAKWEMLSGKESQSPPESPTHPNKSKIPRPVASPVKPSGIPVPVSKPISKLPPKKSPTTAGDKKVVGGNNLVKSSPAKKGAVAR